MPPGLGMTRKRSIGVCSVMPCSGSSPRRCGHLSNNGVVLRERGKVRVNMPDMYVATGGMEEHGACNEHNACKLPSHLPSRRTTSRAEAALYFLDFGPRVICSNLGIGLPSVGAVQGEQT